MPFEVDGLLVKVRSGAAFSAANNDILGKGTTILEVPPGSTGAMGLDAAEHTSWVKIDAGDNPWDRAHALMSDGFSASGSGAIAAEPDIAQTWEMPPSPDKVKCVSQPPSSKGGMAIGPHFAWHLDDHYSGLKSARESVSAGDQAAVIIAHLDTGYDHTHKARPANILTALERNFTKEGAPNSAQDVTPAGFVKSRGHGMATMALLAGADPGGLPEGFIGAIGGAPGASIIPIRIADFVVRLTTSTMVQGFAHALANKADVLSMSMGGLASAAVADVVNQCYEAGIVMVTAAGNFVGGIPSPRSIVYPARMRRVIAATGVMANGDAYFGLDLGTMQGCHGPDSKMDTALGGWTPNTPWAELGCLTNVDQDGSGTSSATPQIAATAALWIAKNRAKLAAYPHAWQRGEAVRQALFGSGRSSTDLLNAAQVRELLGRGSLNAVAALAMQPAAANTLVRAPIASASFDWFKLLTGTGVGLASEVAAPRAAMLELEMVQLAQLDPEIDDIVPDPDGAPPSEPDRKRYLEAIRDSKDASKALKHAIERALGTGNSGPPTLPKSPRKPAFAALGQSTAATAPKAPKLRRLRVFALDPSLGGNLDSYAEQIATIDVRYETDGKGQSILRPGPVGDYLEVVDVDPASNQFYPPVDLDHPHLLVQDGHEPSEGNPQFHQQMVYAIAMRTIESFENALGRVALWSAHKSQETQKYEYVPRLRIYPHALRAKNAYYSPDRVALLLGYFPAESRPDAATAAGTLVFSCLSADIIAHEMTHALLDGYTKGYREPSNPDVGAFHEGFSDIVALFQHFQYRDLVRREIAKARGNLGAASLLGGLAKQFGEGSGKSGALRDYLSKLDGIEYKSSFESHARGSLLVVTIYEAFQAIFERRTGDLIRLATGGSGLLGDGAIHPDLVERLTDEACSTAGQVLRMCIRALDYCPPNDITFGAFLRGLITADVEAVSTDRYGYRTAFLEKFRRRNLLPANLRTVSVESLCWQKPYETGALSWLQDAVDALDMKWRGTPDRKSIYYRSRIWCGVFHSQVTQAMSESDEARRAICKALGLQPDLKLYDTNGIERPQSSTTGFTVDNVRGASRVSPEGNIIEEIIITLTQRKPIFYDPGNPAAGFFWYRGGSTVIINPNNRAGDAELKYVISKSMMRPERLEAEREFRTNPPTSSQRGLYFGDSGLASREPFAALHRDED